MALTVAILGRPNVGKSTLFNRLVGKRLAIVDDRPGVTRDRREGEARLADLSFRVIDTAGFEDARGDDLAARIQAQTERALDEADVALLVVDARAGVTPMDESLARLVRASNKPVVLIANKCEGRAGAGGLLEAFGLGLDEPVAFSAEHGEGIGELYDALQPLVDAAADPPAAVDAEDSSAEGVEEVEAAAPGPLQLAVVGRPNVGKSTLINQLIGVERLITGPEAGITRDSIAIAWEHGGRPVRLIDTAGMRRRARVNDALEVLSVQDTLRAIRYANVVALVIDATEGLERQDLTIARMIGEEGRAPLLVANKSDLVTDAAAVRRGLAERIETSLPQLRGLATVLLSAKTGRNMEELLPAALAVDDIWNRQLPTAPLNRWLMQMVERNPPPIADGRPLRIRYVTQTKTRPPTFLFFANRPQLLPEAYHRYLAGGLRDAFTLPGVPLRLIFRKGRNPYDGDRS
ncbi:MAG: ribosome biogenesis GTPase Der [Rhodospirillales bacterium]